MPGADDRRTAGADRSAALVRLRAVEWVALIVLVPIAGPAIWFAYGRRRFLD